jgi:hypothetical protein
MGRKSGEVSGLPPAFAYRFPLEPGEHPHDMPGCRREEGLAGRARQAAVATRGHIKAPDAWREATRHTRPPCLLGFERGRLLALSRGREGFVVGVGADGKLAWRLFGCGTGAEGGRAGGSPDRVQELRAVQAPCVQPQ